MTLLEDAVNEKQFDSRVVGQNISRGVVKTAEFQKFLKSLPDEAENADWVDLEELAKQDPVPTRLPKNPETTQSKSGTASLVPPSQE